MHLNYKTFGEGRPVVILHGLFGAARNWQGIARILAEHYQVITPDLRNHGQSPHAPSMSYADMADDVVAVISALQLRQPIVIGHSMGGKIAMTIALSRPDLLCGLVVVDIAPVTYEHDFTELIEAMRSLSLSEIQQRAEAEAILMKKLDSPKLVAFIMQNLVRADDGLRWRVNLQQIAANLPELGQFPDRLKGRVYPGPCLFIGGTGSTHLSRQYNLSTREYFPAADIRLIENAGHWVHADQPAAFLDTVLPFIQSI